MGWLGLKSVKKFAVILLVVWIAISLCGCTAIGIDVESQLRPPKNNGEQELLQNALDSYVLQNKMNKYSLKYPSEGKYLSSFILLDEVNVPVYIAPEKLQSASSWSDEAAHFCVAFYQPSIDGAKAHIHLLQHIDGNWVSVADVEGRGDTIAQVDFADIDGDSFPELLVGWNLYNTKDKILYVYSIKGMLSVISTTEMYTSMQVTDLTGEGADDILLLSVDPFDNTLTSRLIAYREDQLTTIGDAIVDTDILTLGECISAIFSEDLRGVFLDVYKDPDTTVTELILWEDVFLWTPFYSASSQMNAMTARPFSLSCRDVDGDGVMEWPVLTDLLMGEDVTSDDVCWKTSWYYYDPTSSSTALDFNSVANMNDGYLLRVSDAFPENFTITYHPGERVLEFLTTTEEEKIPFLKIQTTTSGKKSDLMDGFTYFDSFDSLHFAVWHNKDFSITTEEIRYLFFTI